MNRNLIAETISTSIKEKKWLSISYINKDDKPTEFWCSIHDINIEKKSFCVHIYNYHKSDDVKKGYIYFNGIQGAKIIDGTTYHVPNSLYEKINNHIGELSWLHYDGYSDSILKYLHDCYQHDNDPFQEEYDLISGIDLNTLRIEGKYKLSPSQVAEIAEKIYKITKINKDEKKRQFQELIINIFSIAINKKLYVVAYKKIILDITNQELWLDDEILFNKSFLIDENKISLNRYFDIGASDFCENFATDINYYLGMINDNLKSNEEIDTKPYVMLLKRDIRVNLTRTFDAIKSQKKQGKLSIPLESFFGNVSDKNIGKRPAQIWFKDNKFNIDQLRVVFSAMKNPITYVQGPPGTGKTVTIINAILSAFVNDKSALITSNNNKPVNEIYAKIKFFHRNKEVPFPILRLGRMEDNLTTLKNITNLYIKSKNIIIKEYSLGQSKSQITRKFNRLNNILYAYEQKLDLEENYEVTKRLLSTIKNPKLANMLTMRLQELSNQYAKVRNVNSSDVMKFTFVAENNFHFSQYLYYKSFQYIKKLDDKNYKWLFDIIRMPENNDDERIKKNREFNKAISNEEQFSQLLEVFPFIMTTNLSANKLGNPHPYFDLTIMDEAGQCNVATSLIPIIRGQNLVLVGDQNQLEPVIVLDNNINKKLLAKYNVNKAYDYCNNSILTVMQEKDKISQFILLRSHYRCGRNIIKYSNDRFYNGELSIETPFSKNQIEMVSVSTPPGQELKNTSYQEAAQIVDIIKKNNYNDVGIITPFRNQANLINELLKRNNIKGVKAGTIHTYQGDEKSTIIFSTAITKATNEKTYKWVSENKEMINVAVTRAKDNLIAVGDYDLITQKSKSKDNDLSALMKHIKSNGTYQVAPNTATEILGLRRYDTKKEAEFFETLNHIASTTKNIIIRTKVKISTVFVRANVKDQNLYFTGEFDFVIYDKYSQLPLLVIELDGIEHILDYKTNRRDRIKEQICRNNNIELIRIPNNYAKRYNIVKDILISVYTNK